jgi:hypothetical protein
MVLVCVTDQESCGRLIEAGRKLADITDDIIFSGMMQGVLSIMKESINKGDIEFGLMG